MSGFRKGGRGGGGGPPKGLFVNGVWHCDCNPRVPAVHFQVKKDGANKGKWFRTCQKQQDDKGRCAFFLWDNDAHGREAVALANNARTESGPAQSTVNSNTPSRRKPSPPPPYTAETTAAARSRKRAHSIHDNADDEYGIEQSDAAFNDELDQVMAQVETPNKAVKTNSFVTPTTARRKLPWQMEQSTIPNAYGLQTPQSDQRTSEDPFSSMKSMPGRSLFTPSKVDEDGSHQTATPSSSLETPTPSRFKNVVADDLARDVFGLLQAADIHVPIHTEVELRSLLLKHTKSAEGYRRGRDVIRTTVKAKDAKITELTYRISTLEAELEAEKAMVKHLQWEAEDESLDT